MSHACPSSSPPGKRDPFESLRGSSSTETQLALPAPPQGSASAGSSLAVSQGANTDAAGRPRRIPLPHEAPQDVPQPQMPPQSPNIVVSQDQLMELARKLQHDSHRAQTVPDTAGQKTHVHNTAQDLKGEQTAAEPERPSSVADPWRSNAVADAVPSSSVVSSAPDADKQPTVGWFVPPLDLTALGGAGLGSQKKKPTRATRPQTEAAASQGGGTPGAELKAQDEKAEKPPIAAGPLTVEAMLEADNGESSESDAD